MSVSRPSPPPVQEGEQSTAKSTSSTPLTHSSQKIAQLPEEITHLVRIRHMISQPFTASFIAGGCAGAVSRTLVSPLERLKILLQVQGNTRTEYKLSIPSALAKMWREEGLKGFMRGNGSNCIRIVPYSAVQFSSYGFYKRVRCVTPFPPIPTKPIILSRFSNAYAKTSPTSVSSPPQAPASLLL